MRSTDTVIACISFCYNDCRDGATHLISLRFRNLALSHKATDRIAPNGALNFRKLKFNKKRSNYIHVPLVCLTPESFRSTTDIVEEGNALDDNTLLSILENSKEEIRNGESMTMEEVEKQVALWKTK